MDNISRPSDTESRSSAPNGKLIILESKMFNLIVVYYVFQGFNYIFYPKTFLDLYILQKKKKLTLSKLKGYFAGNHSIICIRNT